MKYSKFLMVIFLLYASCSSASENENRFVVLFDVDSRWLSLDKDTVFELGVSDQVSDGCWKNIEATKNAVELELNRSSFQTSKDQILGWNVVLKSVGYGFGSNLCAVYYELSVRAPDFRENHFGDHGVRALYYSTIWSQGGIMTGVKDSMSSRLKTAYVELIQVFLLDINKQKRALLEEAIKASDSPEQKNFWSSYKME